MEYFVTPKINLNNLLKNIKNGDIIILEDGIYNEKIEVWNDNIKIKAKNTHKAIISNNDYYHKIMKNNNECNTFGTYTLLIGGNNVTLEGLIIENRSTPSTKYGQAVALHVEGTHFTCDSCIIRSAQDTLFTGPLPKDLCERYKNFYPDRRLKGTPSIQYYFNCDIIGDVDFIFGGATALFESCNIISLPKEKAYICAPSHAKELKFGYLFYQCTLKGTTDNSTFLARPWRDYGTAAFIDCILEKHIKPEGFNKWDNTNRDQTARFYEYGKYELKDRVKWVNILNSDEADLYVKEFKYYMQNN